MKISTATTSVQKYSSLPLPKGYILASTFFDCFIPNHKRNWLPVSTNECIASENIALDIVIVAIIDLAIPIEKLTDIARKTVLDDSLVAISKPSNKFLKTTNTFIVHKYLWHSFHAFT